MNAPTMAIQLRALQDVQAKQSRYDVVKTGKDAKDFKQGEINSFEKLLKKLAQDGVTKEASEQILSEMLEKESEQNGTALAAELLAQNPLIAALIAMAGEQKLTVNGDAQIAAQQIIGEGTQPSAQELLTQLANNAQNSTALNVQVQAKPQFAEQMLQTLANAQAVNVQAVNVQAQTAQLDTQMPQTVANAPAVNVQTQTAQPQTPQAQTQVMPVPVAFEVVNKIVLNAETQDKTQDKTQSVSLNNSFALEIAAQKVKQAVNTGAQNDGAQGESKSKSENKGANAEQATFKTQTKETTTQLDAEKLELVMPKMQDTQQVRFEAKSIPLPNAKEVLTQVQTGIMQNAKTGTEDFVLRLRPEGLGEIMVKMTSENGRIVMQLSAQNQHVQRILSNEIESLRSSVSPFNVEVKEIANSNSSHFENNSQQQSTFSQGQFQNQFTNQNGKNTFVYQAPSYGRTRHDEIFSEQDIITAQTIKTSAIDTYI